MKKQLKSIIIIAVVIAVLALALWGISLIPKDTDNVTSGVSQAVDIYEVDKGNIQSIKIKNELSEYTLLSDGEGGFSEESTKEFPQYTSNVTSVVYAASNVTAKRLIEENCTDFSKYGLDDAKITSELTDTDGKTYKLSIGNEAPTGGYYFLYNDIPNVYTISVISAEAFMHTPLNFVDVTLSDTLEQLSYERIELFGEVREKPIIIVNMESLADEDDTVLFVYDIISPGNSHLETNMANDFLGGFSGMVATKAEVLNPTAEDLTKYGFDKPYSAAKFETETTTRTVTVGKIEDDIAYVMRDDLKVIYSMNASSIYWLTTQYPDLVSNLFLTPYIGDVVDVTVAFDSQTYTFKTEYTDETDLTVTYKGAKLDKDNFKRFYQVLVSAYLEEYSEEPAQGEASLTITYTYRNGNKDEVKLFTSQNDPRKVIVVLNGKETQFLMRYNFMEKVKADVENLLNGKEIKTDW